MNTESLLIKTFGSEEEKLTTCDTVKFILESHLDRARLPLSAFVVPNICEPLQYQLTSQACESYHHLGELTLADASNGEQDSDVDILIGCDQYWEIVTGEIRRDSSLVENCSRPKHEHAVNVSITHFLRLGAAGSPMSCDSTDQELRQFEDLESLGISKEEKSVTEEFKSSISFKEGRYEVKLPWKEQHPLLPDNYELSQKCLWNLHERLQRDPGAGCIKGV